MINWCLVLLLRVYRMVLTWRGAAVVFWAFFAGLVSFNASAQKVDIQVDVQVMPLDTDIYHELWSWDSGRALMFRAGANTTISNTLGRPQGLINSSERWSDLLDAGFELDRSNIQMGQSVVYTDNRRPNDIKYFYQIDELEERGLRCILFHQDFPLNEVDPFFRPPNPFMSSGEVSGFDCRPMTSVSAEAFEALWVSQLDDGFTARSRAR